MDEGTILSGFKKIQKKHRVRHKYHCWTCRIIGENVLCLPLVKLNHTNHNVTYSGMDAKACSCGTEEYLREKLGLLEPNEKYSGPPEQELVSLEPDEIQLWPLDEQVENKNTPSGTLSNKKERKQPSLVSL